MVLLCDMAILLSIMLLAVIPTCESMVGGGELSVAAILAVFDGCL